ncbi:MAG: M14 family metallopeptidase [Flavobacteriaceae bacterium]
MSKKIVFLLLCVILYGFSCQAKNLKKDHNTTIYNTSYYIEVINFYNDLSKIHKTINLKVMGLTDSGHPLHLVTFNPEGTFDFGELQKEKAIILINNGIHPGEPDGLEATMQLFSDLANGTIIIPKNTIIAAIPVYNIGGALNRNSTTRTNQNGPEEYGFRGNARNYDLNRDFIKSDSRNARAFAELFHYVNPDVFIDNHVSNGADYQYTLTHLFTQHNKLGGALGDYLNKTFIPEVEKNLKQKEWDITPYVNVFNRAPDTGFIQFMDTPRYSTGYTTLFNSIGMMVETHMLKPYEDRVKGTYEIMKSMIEVTDANFKSIKSLRKNAFEQFKTGEEYPIQWEVDSTQYTSLKFKGYESEIIKSKVTGKDRLFYDRDKPFTKEIPFYNYFKPKKSVRVPKGYIIPQGWWNVIELLKVNQIEMLRLEKDTLIQTEVYRIEDFNTRTSPYEGHYMHYNTSISKQPEETVVKKGDYLILTDQPEMRYLLETLEPEAMDSFFNWNFFDTILQQKEGFSPYVFEEIAEELLENNAELKQKFELKKQEDNAFRENGYAQLNWLHKQSEHYEKAHMRYPILRVLN